MTLEGLNASATSFAQAEHLHRHVAANLLERLAPITLQPKRVLELGCACGAFTVALQQRFPEAEIIGIDIAEQRIAQAEQDYPELKFICADAAALPFAEGEFDLVVSNLMLHWHIDVQAVLDEVHRVTADEGLFLFSYYGPDTFKQAGEAQGQFFDMHDLGDALVRTQFNNPVLDIEHISVDYDSREDIVADLTANGESYLIDLTTQPLDKLHYEVVYGHAWRLPEPMTSKIDQDGMVRISPAQILRKT